MSKSRLSIRECLAKSRATVDQNRATLRDLFARSPEVLVGYGHLISALSVNPNGFHHVPEEDLPILVVLMSVGWGVTCEDLLEQWTERERG